MYSSSSPSSSFFLPLPSAPPPPPLCFFFLFSPSVSLLSYTHSFSVWLSLFVSSFLFVSVCPGLCSLQSLVSYVARFVAVSMYLYHLFINSFGKFKKPTSRRSLPNNG